MSLLFMSLLNLLFTLIKLGFLIFIVVTVVRFLFRFIAKITKKETNYEVPNNTGNPTFADQLRNTEPVKQLTKEDKWRSICHSAGVYLIGRIEGSCKSAAINGKREAVISKEYGIGDDTSLFPYSAYHGLTKHSIDPYVKIMKEVISPMAEKRCNELGLKFLGAGYYVNRNSGYCTSYEISIKVGW